MVRIGAIERQVVMVLDAKGTPLTAATAGALDEEDTLALDDVDDHGALINYYFGRCGRIVIIEHDGTALEGTLDTRWLSSERRWWIGLSQAVAARTRAPIARPEPSLPPEPVMARDDALAPEPAQEDARVPVTFIGQGW
jgi:hypothetical protein